MRASSHQRIKNALKHRSGIAQHIVIPEADHAKPEASKIPRSLQIECHVVRVLPAIDLHDQARTHADKVHDVFADWLLSTEAVVAEMPVA